MTEERRSQQGVVSCDNTGLMKQGLIGMVADDET